MMLEGCHCGFMLCCAAQNLFAKLCPSKKKKKLTVKSLYPWIPTVGLSWSVNVKYPQREGKNDREK